MNNYDPRPSEYDNKKNIPADFSNVTVKEKPMTATQIEEAADAFFQAYWNDHQPQIILMEEYHISIIQPIIDKMKELANEPR